MVHSKLDTFSFRWSLLGGLAPGAVLMPGFGGSPNRRPSTRELPRAASQNQWPAFLKVLTGDASIGHGTPRLLRCSATTGDPTGVGSGCDGSNPGGIAP